MHPRRRGAWRATLQKLRAEHDTHALDPPSPKGRPGRPCAQPNDGVSLALLFSSFCCSRSKSAFIGTKTTVHAHAALVEVLAVGLFAMKAIAVVQPLLTLVCAFIDFVALVRLPAHSHGTREPSHNALRELHEYPEIVQGEIDKYHGKPAAGGGGSGESGGAADGGGGDKEQFSPCVDASTAISPKGL
ncbi:hypothetical protein H9P43_006952 [Blastocladiella emersonii ATCC 22665]|nr:hypothetical protein H9P43_006952 [Blastocladiella emersonii ATCC 22665]